MGSPFLPSEAEQLDAIRDASESGFTLVHIDTCLGCYLSDHHNRDGELLLGVYVDGETTIGAVFNDLQSELAQLSLEDGERGGFDYAKARQAIATARAEHHPMDQDRSYFDSSLETPSDDDEMDGGDYVQAWFLIVWTPTEGGDDA